MTAAMPIGNMVADMMREYEDLKPNPAYSPIRKPIVRFADQDDEEKARLISQNPDYGEMICRCEKVSKAEILQAIHNPLGVHTVTGVKYRTRAMMGRCQGGYCQMRIEQLLEQELGLSEREITYAREQSWVLSGKVREEEA